MINYTAYIVKCITCLIMTVVFLSMMYTATTLMNLELNVWVVMGTLFFFFAWERNKGWGEKK